MNLGDRYLENQEWRDMASALPKYTEVGHLHVGASKCCSIYTPVSSIILFSSGRITITNPWSTTSQPIRPNHGDPDLACRSTRVADVLIFFLESIVAHARQ